MTEDRTCMNCEHRSVDYDDEPCVSCSPMELQNWKEIEMSITSENPKRGLAQYVEEQQEDQQESGPKPTQLKRYRGGAQQESKLRRVDK